VLGLVLVAIPLYMCRRPRAESPLTPSEIRDDRTTAAAPPPVTIAVDAGASGPLALTEPMVLECHDPGSKKTAPDQCDHLVGFEKAFAKAIEDSAACVPAAAGGGTISYVADVSFGRKRKPIDLTLGKENRTLKSGRAGTACAAAVKRALPDTAIDGLAHAHSRYKIEIVATYPGAVK